MSKASKQAVLNSSVEMIREYYEKEHKHNKDRIKYGIIAMLIIPIVFLILLFVVNSSKVIFLVMWIASLFIISGYLIAIEYKDYNMSENLKDIIGNENKDTLIDTTKVITDIAKNYVSPVESIKSAILEDEHEGTNCAGSNDSNQDNDAETIESDNINSNYIDNDVKSNNYNDTIPINNINNGSSYNTDNKTDSVAVNNSNNMCNDSINHNTPAGNTLPANCQNIVIDNKLSNNTITISIDNITNAVNITINPNKEAVK